MFPLLLHRKSRGGKQNLKIGYKQKSRFEILFNKIGLNIVGILLFVTIWWLVSLFLPPVKLPSPLNIFKKFISLPLHTPYTDLLSNNPPGMIDDILMTFQRAFLGHILGSGLGIGIGYILGCREKIRLFVEPMIEVVRVAPPLIYLTFFILWFGVSTFSILLLITSVTFLRIVINTIHAVHNVSPVYKNFARTLGATDRDVYLSVVIPASIPELIGPMRAMIPYNFGAALVAELLGAQQGIGYQFMSWLSYSLTSHIITGLMFVSLLAVIVDYIQYQILSYITRWKEK